MEGSIKNKKEGKQSKLIRKANNKKCKRWQFVGTKFIKIIKIKIL